MNKQVNSFLKTFPQYSKKPLWIKEFNTFASGLSLSSNEPSSSGPRENKASKRKSRITDVNDITSFLKIVLESQGHQ